mgnify:CR=1 FL=1
MLGSLRNKRRYYEPRRREGERDYDSGHSGQEKSDKDRGYVHRSRSRSPPPRTFLPPAAVVARPTEVSRPKPPSQAPRSDPPRETEITTSSTSTPVATDSTSEGALKLAQMRKEFPDICFDGYVFPPHLKRIPPTAKTTIHDYVVDIFF